jgi:hypothetical protein
MRGLKLPLGKLDPISPANVNRSDVSSESFISLFFSDVQSQLLSQLVYLFFRCGFQRLAPLTVFDYRRSHKDLICLYISNAIQAITM